MPNYYISIKHCQQAYCSSPKWKIYLLISSKCLGLLTQELLIFDFPFFNTQALSSLSIQLRFSLLGAALRQEALTFKKLFEVVGNCRHFLLESLSQNSTPCFLSNNKARHLLFAHTHHELIQQCYDPEGPFSKSCFWICPGPLVMYWPHRFFSERPFSINPTA